MGTPASVATGRNREYEPPDEAQLLADLSALVSPPKVCVRLHDLVNSSKASADDVAELVSLDPNLTGRLLRIVNSSFYGFPSQIETVARSVTILGMRELSNLVLAISAVRSFSKVGDGLVRIERFWQHSVLVALLARQLARHFRVPEPDRLFVAGLLHEVGCCVIYSQIPWLCKQMQEVLEAGEPALHHAELEYLGYSHASVGARILEEWQLPGRLQDAVRHHHNPGAASDGRTEASLVHLADALCAQSDPGALSRAPSESLLVDSSVWDVLGAPLSSDDTSRIVDEAGRQFSSTMQSLLPKGSRG